MINTVRKATIIIAAAAATTPAKVPVDTPEIVEAVQLKLRSLGYVGAGPPDGENMEKTQSAILDFRNRNNLPTSTSIDGDLLNGLLEAPPKSISVEQATATEKQIAPNVAAAKSNLWTRFWAKITAIPAIFGAVILGVINNLGDAINLLAPLKLFLSDWLQEVDKITLVAISGFLIATISGILWYSSRSTGNAITKGYRDGTVQNDHTGETP